jgi:tetratricopeptide (TPR) repeat protein
MATAQTPQPLQLRNSVEGQVEVVTNAAGRGNLFAIEAAQGQFFQIDVRKNGVDVLVNLADPSGKTILIADSPGNPTGQLIILWIAADAGRYSVRISLPDRARQPGPYQIEWKELREPVANDRIRLDAQAKLYQGAAQDRTGNREGRAAAIASYKDAIEIRARLSQPPGVEEAYCLRRIGQLLSEAGDQIKAIESLEKALAIQTAVRDQPAASIT